MKLLFDLLPVLLFFLTYWGYGIFVATAVAMAASAVVLAWGWWRSGRLEPMALLSAGLIVVFGGATLLFQDERFIKLKPTVLYAVMALLFWGSTFRGRPLAERMFAAQLPEVPASVLRRLNSWWTLFFVGMAALNLVVATRFDSDTWVRFKLFGLLGLTLVFVVLQAVYLGRIAGRPAPPDSEAGHG